MVAQALQREHVVGRFAQVSVIGIGVTHGYAKRANVGRDIPMARFDIGRSVTTCCAQIEFGAEIVEHIKRIKCGHERTTHSCSPVLPFMFVASLEACQPKPDMEKPSSLPTTGLSNDFRPFREVVIFSCVAACEGLFLADPRFEKEFLSFGRQKCGRIEECPLRVGESLILATKQIFDME